MNIEILNAALINIPAGQHGAVMIKGTPVEVDAFNWEINRDDVPFLLIKKADGSFCMIETSVIDWFYTYPIPKVQQDAKTFKRPHKR